MGENLIVLNTVQCTQCIALHPLNSRTAGGACLARTEAVVRSDDQHTTLVRGCATMLEVMGKTTYLAMASYYLNLTWMTERILSFIALFSIFHKKERNFSTLRARRGVPHTFIDHEALHHICMNHKMKVITVPLIIEYACSLKQDLWPTMSCEGCLH